MSYSSKQEVIRHRMIASFFLQLFISFRLSMHSFNRTMAKHLTKTSTGKHLKIVEFNRFAEFLLYANEMSTVHMGLFVISFANALIRLPYLR